MLGHCSKVPQRPSVYGGILNKQCGDGCRNWFIWVGVMTKMTHAKSSHVLIKVWLCQNSKIFDSMLWDDQGHYFYMHMWNGQWWCEMVHDIN